MKMYTSAKQPAATKPARVVRLKTCLVSVTPMLRIASITMMANTSEASASIVP